jgi:hypothetical protein
VVRAFSWRIGGQPMAISDLLFGRHLASDEEGEQCVGVLGC